MTASTARPRLAVVYDPQSLTPMDVARAARPVCDLVWVLDLTDPALAPLAPLLRRFGAVIDIAGLGAGAAADLVAREPVDGIITFAEQQMTLASTIADRLDLRFHSPQTAACLVNKYRQREALAAAGVPGPAFWPLAAGSSERERSQLAAEVRYPVVVKPQGGTGSRETHLVPDRQALLRLLSEIGVEPGGLLLEEALSELHPLVDQRFSDVLMVESAVSGGAFSHVTATGHFVRAAPFRGTGSFVPSHLDATTTRQVFEAAEAAASALDIQDGFINTDLMLTPEGPRVLEVNGRIGGQVPALLELIGGPPIVSLAMRSAIGERTPLPGPLQSQRVAYCSMYQPPMHAQRLLELRGLDEVANLPGVTEVVLNRRPGDALDWRQGTDGNLFRVFGTTPDHERLYDLYQQIDQLVDATYEERPATFPGW